MQPWPHTMCIGKPGQMIARNMKGDEKSVVVFDITQIPFRVVVPEIKLGMKAKYLCYLDIPGKGGVLAVSDQHKLCLFSMDSGDLLWSFECEDEGQERPEAAGATWEPHGVCTDNRGRLYVADKINDRIIVFLAVSGSLMQEIEHESPKYLCWYESTKSVIVGNHRDISYYHVTF